MAIRTESDLTNLLKSVTAKQIGDVRQGIAEFTTAALATREVNMKTMKATLTAVLKAANSAVSKNPILSTHSKELLEAIAQGVDEAMANAIGAIRCASEHFLSLGAPTETPVIKGIVKVLEKFPQAFENGMAAANALFDPMVAKTWGEVIAKLKPSSAAIKAANDAAVAIGSYKAPATASNSLLLQAAASIRANIETYIAGVLLGLTKRK